jgi:nucleoside phosphorylase
MLSVLLVEDDDEKATLIQQHLSKQSCVTLVSVKHVRSTLEAKREMQSQSIDLLLLDMALPEYPGEDAARDAGYRLLRDLMETDLYVKPRHILGLTAYDELFRGLEAEFKQRGWLLLHCDRTSESWLYHLSSVIAYHLSSRDGAQARRHGVDVALVTALRDPEFAAIQRLTWAWEAPSLADENTFVYAARTTHAAACSVVSTCVSRMGLVPTALMTAKLLEMFRPRLVAMTGICAGVRGKTQVGDLVFASDSWGWESGKLVATNGGTTVQPDPTSIPTSEFLYARIQQLISNRMWLEKAWTAWQGDKPPQPPNVQVGTMASGSAVVADQDTVDFILSINRRTVAIDMECYGLYAAARAALAPRPHFFTLKGVSDFADSAKDDQFRDYAAYISATAIDYFLETFGHDVRSTP